MDDIFNEVRAERERQIVQGYTSASDDKLVNGELSRLASVYALADGKREDWGKVSETGFIVRTSSTMTSRKEQLICAMALLVAELERLERLHMCKACEGTGYMNHMGDNPTRACALCAGTGTVP